MIVEYMGPHGSTPGLITHVVMIYRPELVEHLRAMGATFIEVDEASADPDKRYVDEGALRDRPVAPITLTAEEILADGADTALVRGVPAGWQIRVDGASAGVSDGSDIEMVSSEPHVYTIEAEGPWPFRPWRGQVAAA